MKEKIHFLETDKGYQFLTSTAYDEMTDYSHIKKEVVEEVEKTEIEKIFKKSWQEVKEYIKNKVGNLTN